jgi:hypothetical protein
MTNYAIRRSCAETSRSSLLWPLTHVSAKPLHNSHQGARAKSAVSPEQTSMACKSGMFLAQDFTRSCKGHTDLSRHSSLCSSYLPHSTTGSVSHFAHSKGITGFDVAHFCPASDLAILPTILASSCFLY